MTKADITLVRDFLTALTVPDTERAVAMLAPDVEWLNTGLPTFRGERVRSALRDMERRGIGFEVEIHHIASAGDTVLTDRTDVLTYGPVRTEFRVSGTFRVRDGLITRWDDHFSPGGLLLGAVVGTARSLRGRIGR